MGKAPGPSVRRRQLGGALRKLRINAGVTRKDAADWLELTDQTLSKIELGRQAIKGTLVRLACQRYDVDAGTLETLLRLSREANQRGWWTAYRDTVPASFLQFVGLEADATDIWTYENQFVPGLLQTPEYVAAITQAAWPEASSDDLAQSANFRQKRQDHLAGEHPPKLHAYIDEAVARRSVGDPDVMHAQLEHLADVSTQDNIELRVVPFAAGAHAAMADAFVMMQFPEEDGPAFAYLENDRGAVYQEDPGDIDRYTFMVGQLDRIALDADNTRALLKCLATEHGRT